MPSIQNYGVIASVQITRNGETRGLSDWCKLLGLPYRTAYMRYTRGVRDPEELLFVPHHKKDTTGAWVHYASITDLKKQRATQTNFAMTNILPEATAAQVRQVAKDMDTTPDQVIITLVEHGLKKLRTQGNNGTTTPQSTTN